MAKIFSYPEKAPSMPWAIHSIPLGKEHGLKSPPCVFPHDNQEFPAFIGNSFPFDVTDYLIVSLGFFIQVYLILYALLYFMNIIFLIDGRFVATMCSRKSISVIFPTALAHHVSLSHFGNSCSISKFLLLLYLLWWSMISDL